MCVLCPPGEVVEVREASYLLSPLEVVDRTAPGTQEELSSSATPVTMIWLVSDFLPPSLLFLSSSLQPYLLPFSLLFFTVLRSKTVGKKWFLFPPHSYMSV